jgi:hypothetical protein
MANYDIAIGTWRIPEIRGFWLPKFSVSLESRLLDN